MTGHASASLCVGFLTIGRRRPGFDPEWGREMSTAAWRTCDACFRSVRPSEPVVDDRTLRLALTEFEQAKCDTLVVSQPTMGDGRLAPILAQLWNWPLVLWATPERPGADRVTACSLVGTHVFASIFRQMGKPFELVYGAPEAESTREQLSQAVRLAVTVATARRAKVGLIGYHAPGFINMHADPTAMNRHLGVNLYHIGLAEFKDRVEAIEADRVAQDMRELLQLNLPRAADLGDEDLVPNSRYHLAILDLMEDENLAAVALRCWPELPAALGHWPYLALMRLAEAQKSISLEGDVDGAILGLLATRLGIGTGYVSDWLEHDERSITLWHPGHAPRSYCVAESVKLGRHFNNDKPLVVNAQLLPDRPVTLARLWRCDDRYHLAAFEARTADPRGSLLGAHGRVEVEGVSVSELFERMCRAGMPHHITVFQGTYADLLRQLAERLGISWLDLR